MVNLTGVSPTGGPFKKMKNLPRVSFLIAALLLVLVFAFPLWQITLFAPQYPDGITMYIWVNKISGNGDGVLQNINILNHYIGMAKIEPESIPELQYFPYILYAMIATGVALFFVNRPKGFLIWSIVLIVLGILGIYDFYLWEYEYGHNLSPDAPIKIPGMVYQPPLFGRKMLLNFEAFSYPHWGSFFLGFSILLGLVAAWLGNRQRKSSLKAGTGVLGLFTLAFILNACSTGPRPIQYGEAQCAHCQMTIVDSRYGGELVSDKGKIFPFDAIECLLQYAGENPEASWKHRLVTAWNQPGSLIPAESVSYLRSEDLPSPMGMHLSAYDDPQVAHEMRSKHGGQLYTWKELTEAFPSMRPRKPETVTP